MPEFLLRKPTPEERKEIIVNYILIRSGENIDMVVLVDKLCISYRLLLLEFKS